MPKFSIITVCRNEAQGIAGTCESIVGQSNPDYEWIVIDGASTDGTLEKLEAYRDRITKLVSEPDKGIYDAMNKGLALAQGEYLVFMNGGDAFASSEILELVEEAPEVDIIYGNLCCGGQGDHHAPSEMVVEYPDVIKPGYLLTGMMPHQASFCHARLFERIGHYDTSYRIAADYDFFIRALKVEKASHHHIPKPFATFDLNGVSSSKQHRALRKRENHRVRMKYYPRYRWSFKAWRNIMRPFWAQASAQSKP